MLNIINSIIKPETELEREIIKDPEFVKGVMQGKPRHGHPEGEIIYHIREVLENIDKYDFPNREVLRLIAIIHDSFKHQVDRSKPKVGDNHHGMIARKFAEKYLDNQEILWIIEHHDDAYNAWAVGDRKNDWRKAEQRADKLIDDLEEMNSLDTYTDFFRCDNETGNKTQKCVTWFNNLI